MKLFRLTWDEPIKAMPFVLTRMTLALWPVAWVRIPGDDSRITAPDAIKRGKARALH